MACLLCVFVFLFFCVCVRCAPRVACSAVCVLPDVCIVCVVRVVWVVRFLLCMVCGTLGVVLCVCRTASCALCLVSRMECFA